MNKRTKNPGPADPEARPGTGALCAEAQADGVPCTERGRECETCERGLDRSPGKSESSKKWAAPRRNST